ncbi:MAG TPA: hypothetical protein VGJ22_06380 [Anaerolineales bacterium]|jgi:hypothetical protein
MHSDSVVQQLAPRVLSLLVLAACACVSLVRGPQEQATIQIESFGAGPFVLADPRVGLSDLPSYTATLTLSFDGTKYGTAQHWTKTYVMLASNDPQTRELSLDKAGDLSDLDSMYAAERDGASYSWQGDNTCLAGLIQEGDSLSDRFEPAGFLSFVVGADEAGAETINGVASNHYTFDEHAVALRDLADSTGELWIASDGGYVVKYVLTSNGRSDYFGEGIEGTLTEDYELSGVGDPLNIQLPADCPPGLVDAPRLGDASNVVSDLGVLMYTTASGVQDAAAFYQQELPNLGWQATGEPIVEDTSAWLEFEKDGETLWVSITIEEDGTKTVQIALLRTQQ